MVGCKLTLGYYLAIAEVDRRRSVNQSAFNREEAIADPLSPRRCGRSRREGGDFDDLKRCKTMIKRDDAGRSSFFEATIASLPVRDGSGVGAVVFAWKGRRCPCR